MQSLDSAIGELQSLESAIGEYFSIKGLYKNTIIQLQLQNINRKHSHLQQDTPAILEYLLSSLPNASEAIIQKHN